MEEIFFAGPPLTLCCSSSPRLALFTWPWVQGTLSLPPPFPSPPAMNNRICFGMREMVQKNVRGNNNFSRLTAASHGCIVTAASIRGHGRGSVSLVVASRHIHGRGPAAVLLRPAKVEVGGRVI